MSVFFQLTAWRTCAASAIYPNWNCSSHHTQSTHHALLLLVSASLFTFIKTTAPHNLTLFSTVSSVIFKFLPMLLLLHHSSTCSSILWISVPGLLRAGLVTEEALASFCQTTTDQHMSRTWRGGHVEGRDDDKAVLQSKLVCAKPNQKAWT